MMIPLFITYVLLVIISRSLLIVVVATKVCGSNLLTYESAKAVSLLRASGVNIVTIGNAPCEEVCVSRNPVCGSDARTYYNYCHLILALGRGERITPRHSGHCGITGKYVSQLPHQTDSIKESAFYWLPSGAEDQPSRVEDQPSRLEDQPSHQAENMKESAFYWLPSHLEDQPSHGAENMKESAFYWLPSRLEDQPSHGAENMKESAFYWLPSRLEKQPSRRSENKEEGNDNMKRRLSWLPATLKEALRTSTAKQNASLNAENNVKPNISLNAEIVFEYSNKSFTMVIKDNKLEFTKSTDIQKGTNKLQVDKSHRRNPESARGKVEIKLPKKRLRTSDFKKVTQDKRILDAVARDTRKDITRTKEVSRQGERVSDVALDNLKLELKFDLPKGIHSDLFDILGQLQGK